MLQFMYELPCQDKSNAAKRFLLDKRYEICKNSRLVQRLIISKRILKAIRFRDEKFIIKMLLEYFWDYVQNNISKRRNAMAIRNEDKRKSLDSFLLLFLNYIARLTTLKGERW